MYDVALAMQNMSLAAHSLGLGTCTVGLNVNSSKLAEILNIPQGIRAFVMTPLGYPAEEPKVTSRKELSEIILE